MVKRAKRDDPLERVAFNGVLVGGGSYPGLDLDLKVRLSTGRVMRIQVVDNCATISEVIDPMGSINGFNKRKRRPR